MGLIKNKFVEGERMDDERLVDEIARLWVSAGGDAEGFEWLKERIKRRIKELEGERKNGKSKVRDL